MTPVPPHSAAGRRPAARPPRTSRGTPRFVPGPHAPTRHPRQGGAGSVRLGERLTVRFTGVTPDGAAIARLGAVHVAVPFGVPGEEALIEITKGGRRAEGRLLALLRKSPDVAPARCRHFGRCGGCQWQHVAPELQRRLKTRLVKDYLKEHADLQRDVVADTLGAEAWAYRNTLRVVFAERGGEIVLGYRAAGSSRVLDIVECPVQHGANEAMLQAVRDAVSDLGLPIYDHERGTGLVRGVLGMTSFATGHALLTVSSRGPLPDPTAVVHALIDRVPGLAGILNTVQPARSLDLQGPRWHLLWGRDHVEDEIAGLRVRLRPMTAMPANPRGMTLLIDAVRRAADLRSGDVAVDLTADTPAVTLALAQVGEGATGVVRGRRDVDDAWYAARVNGVANALFTTRDAPGVLASLAERRVPDVVVATASGPGLDSAIVAAVALARVPRVVYLARSLATCARDLVSWRHAGYDPVLVQPVDLLPHTSHVHVVAALRRMN
ncbi:MAG: 23S rRNA (uracil(1939)-C(5))-methyltransferase RlmD [Armatimonadota bacterium]|nr:23S rRNA (uracil(1939)-C(5))-methyltransferase RlmD [Armatimonadota bacterium]